MKNIKTIEVTKPFANLNVGDTLTRLDASSNFVNESEVIGEGFLYNGKASIDPAIVTDENFNVTEWFDTVVKKTKSQYIEELETELASCGMLYLERLSKYEKLEISYTKLLNRIDTKLKEFEVKELELENELSDRFLGADRMEWADEAAVVYHNMIDLLKKLKA